MKKTVKVILVAVVTIVLLSSTFAFGVHAANKWMNFDKGAQQVTNTENNLQEMMDILREVRDGKIEAETAVERLKDEIAELEENSKTIEELQQQYQEDLNRIEEQKNSIIQGEEIHNLMQDIKDLEDQLDNAQQDNNENEEYVKHLENELQRANEKVNALHNISNDLMNEAREIRDSNK